MNVVISGSRQINDNYRYHTYNFICDIKKMDDITIIVGDALGIDSVVVWACEEFEIDYKCYGISSEPRNGANNYNRLSLDSFHERDKFMIDISDLHICVWNSESKGTLTAHKYATSIGKNSIIYVIDDMGFVDISESLYVNNYR